MDLSKVRKVEKSSVPPGSNRPDDAEVVATFKVREANYVPPGVCVRARIDDFMFTGRAPAAVIRQLDGDPKVESVAINQRLRSSS